MSWCMLWQAGDCYQTAKVVECSSSSGCPSLGLGAADRGSAMGAAIDDGALWLDVLLTVAARVAN